MLEVSVIVVFIEGLNRFFVPVRELANRFTVFQSALVSVERIAEFSQISVEPKRLKPFKPAVFNESIEFKDVSFSYEGEDEKRVLSEVNFKVNKGEHIAFVGRTGAGKSTVGKLLSRFYDIDHGKLLFDGVNALQMDVFELRSLFNVVPQEVFLFSGTIRENLSYGRDNVKDEEIYDALKRCQASEVVARQGGLDGMVGMGAHQFSLGEKQLLALARAIIAKPQIVILDEATASVDPLTEHRLQVATAEVLKDRTAFIIAHRLSTIESCDRILVFQNGQIIEDGAHNDLIAQDGYYAKLVELQKKEEELKAKVIGASGVGALPT